MIGEKIGGGAVPFESFDEILGEAGFRVLEPSPPVSWDDWAGVLALIDEDGGLVDPTEHELV